jgi:hypothetical protein
VYPGNRRVVHIRLADRTRPTLYPEYDQALGRFEWIDRAGLPRGLVSAVIDGAEITPAP